MSQVLDFRNTNSLWCSVLVETWARCGLRQAVCSPGSRSTPLTMALARHGGIEVMPVLDERSAAFFALGLATASRRPVLLVCTSGSAGANYFPAIIEAHESGVPLLVVTADRPPEMRECASGQTIDQQKLFGDHVTWYHEMAVPEARWDLLRYARQTAAHAFERAVSCGPVHLNAPFRDPLPPIPDGLAGALQASLPADFFDHLETSLPAITATAVLRPTSTRGLIVAGSHVPENEDAYVAALESLASETGWPVLADVLSPARRRGKVNTALVTAYDAILRDEKTAQALVPKVVYCLGAWPTSKVLRQWLERSQAEVVLVSAGSANKDALHGKTRHLPLAPESVRVEPGVRKDPSYAQAWAEAEARVRARLDKALSEETRLFEPKAAWLLAKHLPESTTFFVANSMPVRDLEYFWPFRQNGPVVYFNRGANGIDGNLSTAFGLAHAKGSAVFLSGDLAFLHDSNGLLLQKTLRGGLTVVLINNRGGGIFQHLPVAKFEETFETFFATPQEVDFGKLCAAHGVAHEVIGDWETFVKRIAELPTTGVRVLEIRTERSADVKGRRAVLG